MPTPNMGLTVPVVSSTSGPQYAEDVNASLNKLDQHNHTSGQGVQIPTNGLNINASLAMNNYGLLNTQLVNLQAQASVSPSGTVFRISDDLYYKDGSGNNVRITQGGAVAVSGAVGFSGLPFGTASASYNSANQTFRFQSATNTPANIDCGSVILRQVTTSPNGITLSSPLGLAANYTLTMPSALPASNSFLQVTNTGSVTTVISTSVQSPVGSIIMFAGNSAPTGWLLCDGSVVSQTTYADLYAVVGATYNTGSEGAGNFRLPDFRRRTGVGAGGTGTATLGNAIGNSGGAESVTLSISQMPSHNHGGVTGSTSITGQGTFFGASGGTLISDDVTAGHTHTISSEGGGQAHNNIQPSLVVNYIIKI